MNNGFFGIRTGFWLGAILVVVFITIVSLKREGQDTPVSTPANVSAKSENVLARPSTDVGRKASCPTGVVASLPVIHKVVEPVIDQRSDTEKALNKMGLSLKNSIRVSVTKSVK
jgi:hypothetical protein